MTAMSVHPFLPEPLDKVGSSAGASRPAEGLRVIHVVKHCNHGHGNAHVAIDLACIQASQGYEVVYASEGGDYSGLLESSGVALTELSQSQRHPWRSAGAVLKLAALCRRMRPDLLHAHMMSSAVTGYGASMLTGIPLLTTVHNSFDRHSLLMRLGQRVVAVSEAERRALVRRGFDPRRLDVVLNGPNGSARGLRPLDAGMAPLSAPSVTTVCGLHRRKGVADLLIAFAQAAQDFPAWHLNIIGAGPDRASLETMAQASGLSDRIHFLGSVLSPQPLLERSAIFVLASYAEPCSLAVAEARAAGCAIVATAVGGTPELLEHGRAGRLVEPARPDEIAAELRGLMADPDWLRLWRDRALAGSSHFYVDRLFRDYDGAYRRLLAR